MASGTRGLLSRFFDTPASCFHPPGSSTEPDIDSVQVLAARFAALDARQVAAIRQVIAMVTARAEDERQLANGVFRRFESLVQMAPRDRRGERHS